MIAPKDSNKKMILENNQFDRLTFQKYQKRVTVTEVTDAAYFHKQHTQYFKFFRH